MFESPGQWAAVLTWLLHKRPYSCSPAQLAFWSACLAAWLQGSSASPLVPDEAALSAGRWMARLTTAIVQAWTSAGFPAQALAPPWQVSCALSADVTAQTRLHKQLHIQ